MPDPAPGKELNRRDVLKAAGLALGGLAGAAAAPALARAASRAAASAAAAAAQLPAGTVLLPPYVADVNADLHANGLDVEVVRRALGRNRGNGIQPNPGYDFRADVFGRNSVNADDLASVEFSARIYERIGELRAEPRPITVAWHYGWHNDATRPPDLQTAHFLGGDYASSDPAVEGTFNRLKNEFGITVDALSWITPSENPQNQNNYRLGYMRAPEAHTRYAALLYESTINLQLRGPRIDFVGPARAFLVRDFELMGRFMAELRDASPARVFTLDDRPVVFIFGSHSWGNTTGMGFEYDAMDVAIDEARHAFLRTYGAFPYIVGEEILLAPTDRFGFDRFRRARNFDALFSYHHVGNEQVILAAEGRLQFKYMANNKRLMQRTYQAVRTLRNRYTGQPLLIIPSMAPGFAKRGHATLFADRADYADFMKVMTEVHLNEYLLPAWGRHMDTPKLPAPIYSVGSWNEEFEGHAVFPASRNESLTSLQLGGFDLSSAIKQLFSWNHYAQRPILPPPPAGPGKASA